eukprot:TRINITY_DN7876_c0_g2_i2.p1 TRINITY_DN7876_c0_g2~~TRINITY_DN7876_c0_g2_i2.p1  ORF type:complete len:387 (+),score=51.61 TRINITY_DN7876_c0_g2_i2:50-1210(+)
MNLLLLSRVMVRGRRFATRKPPSGGNGGKKDTTMTAIAGKAMAITMLLSGWFYLASWVRNNMCMAAEFDEIREDLRFFFNAHPHLRPTVIRLVFCQNSMHVFNKGCNVSSANTASLRVYSGGSGPCAGFSELLSSLHEFSEIYPGVGNMDIWTLAACVAVEQLGGPPVTEDWEFGRIDTTQRKAVIDTNLIPPPYRHGEVGCLKNLIEFARMGFTTQEYVCLMGAHTLGSMHKDVSGYDGSWTSEPEKFSNEYFRNLKDFVWRTKNKDTPHAQYQANGVSMLPADVALLQNEETYKYVKLYAGSEEDFRKDFRAAWKRLTDLNMELRLQKPIGYSEHPSIFVFSLKILWWTGKWAFEENNGTKKFENEQINQETVQYVKKRLSELT